MLLGGARPPLGAAYADSVFDAHPAAGSAGWVGERAKLAGTRLGMSGNTADSGLGGGHWSCFSTKWNFLGWVKGVGRGALTSTGS